MRITKLTPLAMKTTLLLSVLLMLLMGCSTAYRTGQTPDDVYFSPDRPEASYVRVQREETRRVRQYPEEEEDRFLRMRVQNRNLWSDLDSWYGFERWSLGYNQFFAPTLNPFMSWNYFYNPYFSPLGWTQAPVVKNVYSRPRLFNLGSYQPGVVNIKQIQQNSSSGSNYIPFGTQNSNSTNSRGNALREAFGAGYPGGSPGGSPVSSPSHNNSSNSSGGSAPVRRF